MPSYTIYPSADDHTLRYDVGDEFAEVFSGSGASSAFVGHNGSSDPFEYFGKFNTAAIAGTVSASSLNINVLDNTADTTVRVRDKSWSTATESNWVPDGSLSNLTLRGSGSVIGTGSKSIPLTSIVVSSAWTVLLHVQGQESSSAGGYIEFSSADASGTTNDPYLSITTVTSVSLTVNNASHDHTATSPTLAAKSTLAVNGATHAHAATSPSLSFIPGVAPDNAVHAHVATSPTLVPHAVLAVNDNHHGHIATSPTLAFWTVLAVNDGLHAHLTTSPALTRTTGLVTITAGGSGPGRTSGSRSYASSSARDYRSGGGRSHTSMRRR